MIDLHFETSLADTYVGPTQRIRILSEQWVGGRVYCPNCGNFELKKYENNRPVADFSCVECTEQYELKSQKQRFGPKIADGAYSTMVGRLTGNNSPNFILLHYDARALSVLDLLVVPKHFFTLEMIEKRRPLASSARRSGWVGCKIRLEDIPRSGLIYLVRNGNIRPKHAVLDQWQATLFLRKSMDPASKGWIINIMKLIEKLGQRNFSLDQLYATEPELQKIYPENQNIKPKIRQQLQVLRDTGYLEFTGRGTYRLTVPLPGSG